MNLWLMKTFQDWANIFINANTPYVAMDEDGVGADLSALDKEGRNSLFTALRLNRPNQNWGLIRRFFDDFYNEMNAGDLIVLGIGQRTTFNVVAVCRVIGYACFVPVNEPRHRRDVELLWRGEPVPVPDWGYARRLERLETNGQLKKFITVYTNLVSH